MDDYIKFFQVKPVKPNVNLPNANYDWTTDSMKYTAQQIGEMPTWIVTLKENFQMSILSVICKSLHMT